MAARGDMAARSQPNASDSFVEQLLRSGPDVSGHDQAEAEAEEVDYGETDEDAQDAEGPHRTDRGRGARRSPAERGKPNPISWRTWQRPEPHRRRSRSRSRGPDLHSARERRYSQEHHDRARAHAFAQEQADSAQWRAVHERPFLRPRQEDGRSPRRTRLERSYNLPDRPHHSMHGPHDGHLDGGCTTWEAARYGHPSDSLSLSERPETHHGRAGFFEGRPRRRSPSLLPERMHMHAPYPRERLLAPAPAGGHWPPQLGEYADDRPPPQRRILLQRAGPEEERLIIRRPLSPERYSPPDADYLNNVNGSLAASRRVEYDPRPLAGYPSVNDHGGWHPNPLSFPHERSPYRHCSPSTGHHSILRAAKGARSPMPREAPEPSHMPRQLPHGQGHEEKQGKAPVEYARPEGFPGPPVLPGPPPMPDQHIQASRRRRTTLFTDIRPASGAHEAPKVEHREGEEAQEQPDRRAGRVARAESTSKDALQEPRSRWVDGRRDSEQSHAVNERTASDPAAMDIAGSMATKAERARTAVDTSSSKRSADGDLADRRHSHSKRPKPEADTRGRTSTAPEMEASHAHRPNQGGEGVEQQKIGSGNSKRSLSAEDRSKMLPHQEKIQKPQGLGAADSKDAQLHKAGSSAKPATESKRADKDTAKGGSTFVRDFYAKSDRSAPGTAADPSNRDGPGEARHMPREGKEYANGRPHKANAGARSPGALREAARAASGPRDALKELRDRGGAKRSVRGQDVRRGGLRRPGESVRDVKSTKHKPLPSWLGDKPEDSNEWFYTDPKGKLQGPCSISSFRLWLMRMKENPDLDVERKEFLKCMVWRKGMNRREPLERLLALADAEAAK